MIKVDELPHYPDMPASVASLEVGVLPSGALTSHDSEALASRENFVSRESSALRLSRLIRREFAFIWRLLRRLGLSSEDADDAAQQVFLVASRRIDSIKVASERSFLFGTALRVASRVRKNRSRRAEVDLLALDTHRDPGLAYPGLADPGLGPDEALDRSRARALLDGILELMSDDIRPVFVLYEIEGLTMAEIAAGLSVPPGTVASRLRRAREVFAEQVSRLQQSLGRSAP